MDVILSTVKWKYAMNYLEDIDAFYNALESNIKRSRSGLRFLTDDCVMLESRNCALFNNNID